jgi:hypothetical protein
VLLWAGVYGDDMLWYIGLLTVSGIQTRSNVPNAAERPVLITLVPVELRYVKYKRKTGVRSVIAQGNIKGQSS